MIPKAAVVIVTIVLWLAGSGIALSILTGLGIGIGVAIARLLMIVRDVEAGVDSGSAAEPVNEPLFPLCGVRGGASPIGAPEGER